MVGATNNEGEFKMEFEWDEETLISLTEDETVFGPDGVYGWLMNVWYRFLAPESAFESLGQLPTR